MPLSKDAEDVGFESFWVHETYFMRDAITQLTASMLSTDRIRLATGCINPFTRHASVVAMTMATLDEYSPGRLILGLGTGYPLRLNQMGLRLERPVYELERRIGEIRELLNGGQIQKGARLMFKPPANSIPVYIGVRGESMLRMAGRVGDGYLAAPAESVLSMEKIVKILSSSYRASGRSDGFEVAANILTYVSPAGQEPLEVLKKDPFVIYMMAVLDNRTVLDSGFRLEDRAKVEQPYMRGMLDQASANITDELLRSFTAIGSEERVIEKLEEFRKAGVDLPVLLPIKPDRASIRRIIELGADYAHS
jgi:alkanesulfonate monooxygenase SsuD/methylene tetrahydromethanopterin reductase-like flavin-dependent oxidoreductase (luciferase family)